MSGHSKWHSIQHKKGAADAARGKVFTKHANLITIAVREGGSGNTDMNPALRLAVEKAKADNMPNANIERAIKKGTGEDKDGAQLYEMQYEGYGPEGVAVIVHALTDNKNRTVTSVRTAFTKNGGSLGETGCVGWMFSKKGLITAALSPERREEVELFVIDAGAEEMQENKNILEITTPPEAFFACKEALEKSGIIIESAEVTLVPENTVKITDPDIAQKVLKLMEVLEEDMDVSSVAANFDIDDEVLEQIADM